MDTNLTPKQAYEHGQKVLQATQLFLAQPRCISCEHRGHGNVCASLLQPIPVEFLHTPNECDAWVFDDIPF